jgi:hypothetical protein
MAGPLDEIKDNIDKILAKVEHIEDTANAISTDAAVFDGRFNYASYEPGQVEGLSEEAHTYAALKRAGGIEDDVDGSPFGK